MQNQDSRQVDCAGVREQGRQNERPNEGARPEENAGGCVEDVGEAEAGIKEPITIYAFVRGGKFLYVGQTVTPEIRRKRHQRSRFKSAEFVVLRTTSPLIASRIERQIIRCLKARGQCRFNKHIPHGSHSFASCQPENTYCEATGQRFNSVYQAARIIGVTAQTLTAGLRARGVAVVGKYRIKSPDYMRYIREKRKLFPDSYK